MTEREQRLLHLLDVAVTYIEQIADKDSPTLEYLLAEIEEVTNEPPTTV